MRSVRIRPVLLALTPAPDARWLTRTVRLTVLPAWFGARGGFGQPFSFRCQLRVLDYSSGLDRTLTRVIYFSQVRWFNMVWFRFTVHADAYRSAIDVFFSRTSYYLPVMTRTRAAASATTHTHTRDVFTCTPSADYRALPPPHGGRSLRLQVHRHICSMAGQHACLRCGRVRQQAWIHPHALFHPAYLAPSAHHHRTHATLPT